MNRPEARQNDELDSSGVGAELETAYAHYHDQILSGVNITLEIGDVPKMCYCRRSPFLLPHKIATTTPVSVGDQDPV